MNSFKNFLFRLGEGSLLIALFGTIVFFAYHRPFGCWLLPAFLITISTLAAWEFCSLVAKKAIFIPLPLLLIGGSSYLLVHTIELFYPISLPLSLLWFLVLLSTLSAFVLRHTEKVLNSVAYTLFGLFYIFLPTKLLLDMTYPTPSESTSMTRWWLIWTLLIIKGSDISAYFVGKLLGKRPLTPISPKKTWEGFHAGWIGGALSSLLMGFAPGAPASLSWILLLLLGGILSICAIIGDLIESRFKREVGIKDSNSALAGLGGFLDMADSLLFATPFAYFCFRYFGAKT